MVLLRGATEAAGKEGFGLLEFKNPNNLFGLFVESRFPFGEEDRVTGVGVVDPRGGGGGGGVLIAASVSRLMVMSNGGALIRLRKGSGGRVGL